MWTRTTHIPLTLPKYGLGKLMIRYDATRPTPSTTTRMHTSALEVRIRCNKAHTKHHHTRAHLCPGGEDEREEIAARHSHCPPSRRPRLPCPGNLRRSKKTKKEKAQQQVSCKNAAPVCIAEGGDGNVNVTFVYFQKSPSVIKSIVHRVVRRLRR